MRWFVDGFIVDFVWQLMRIDSFFLFLKWKDFNFLHFLFYFMFNVERQKKSYTHQRIYINAAEPIAIVRSQLVFRIKAILFQWCDCPMGISRAPVYTAYTKFSLRLILTQQSTERWWRSSKRFTKNIFNHFSKQLKWELFWYCSALRLVFTFCSRCSIATKYEQEEHNKMAESSNGKSIIT